MSNMDKWVDPRISLVTVAHLQTYLLGRGWKLKPSPRTQLLLFEEPPGHKGKAIVQSVPASEGGPDYVDGIVRVVSNLAALENRHAADVLTEILQQTDIGSRNGPAAKPNPASASPLWKKASELRVTLFSRRRYAEPLLLVSLGMYSPVGGRQLTIASWKIMSARLMDTSPERQRRDRPRPGAWGYFGARTPICTDVGSLFER
jgi:hypothetical protein